MINKTNLNIKVNKNKWKILLQDLDRLRMLEWISLNLMVKNRKRKG